ncbi:hypothetical protein AN1V17_35950 [Vallitalea sediminicola]
MKVQEIILEGYRRRYILLDDDGIPIVSVVRYLKHLDNIAKSSTTLKSYCYDLKLYFQYLQEIDKNYLQITINDLSNFVGWLRNPYGNSKVTGMQPAKAKRSETTVNHAITVIGNFYDYLYKTEENKNNILKQLMRYTYSGKGKKYKDFLYHLNKGTPVGKNILKLKEPQRRIKVLSYWIETSITIMKIENHRIPIDNKLADILAVLINKSKKHSNPNNNPDKFIFIRYKGSRKGRPYISGWVQAKLNEFARKCNITDELGNLYHFKNHSFRHTYAVKMINGGADILTVQELLAHASPEMTIRYARLLDDTKRRVFDNAVKQGVFSLDTGFKIREEISEDVFKMLWTNHKLNAIDTSYGTCLQRSNGKCSFAKQPPCLTCNGGNPCKDLCIGAFEGDIKKYQIHINSTKSLIDQAKKHGRNEMAKENEELLRLYEDIAATIKTGNIIYGRANK